MKTDNGRTESVWMKTVDMPASARMAEDATADVCIVGAGVAGLSSAYQLLRAGKSVIILDDGPVAGGETARTTAHLTYYNDDGLSMIESLHGTEGLKLATESHREAVDTIERIVSDEKIDCDFFRTSAYLFITPGGMGYDFLNKELDAAHRIGLADAHWVDRAPLPSFDTSKCLCYPNQAQFHALKYFKGLADAVRKRGGRIFNDTHVANVEGGSPAKVTTAEGRVVTCGAVIVATNSPINDRVVMHTKQSPYRTYVIGLKIRKGLIPRALYWDTMDPYHYARLQEFDDEFEILISGGEDHKTGQANDAVRRWEAIEQWTRERFPEAGELAFRWSGQIMDTPDKLAYIGHNPLDAENVYIATGDSGMGMTHGTLAGILLTDLILGRPNPWTPLYDPKRKPKTLASLGEFAKENLNVAAQYVDLVTPGDVQSVEQIAPDTGAVIREGVHKLACYRDADGTLHKMSAICPHLQCVVMWNGAEKSWDCPCHGSRFNERGKVVNGPAIDNLPAVT